MELFWVDQIAKKIAEREAKLNRGIKVYRTEMGIGASGVPHIGSAGDGVRNYAVYLALKNLKLPSELIAYTDDLDGLRKVPIGFPQSLESEIGKSVSSIPDVFGCHKSFGHHATSMLEDAFQKIGVIYTLKRASEEYKKGTYEKEILEILKNWKEAGKIIKEITNQDKYVKQLPFLPFCKSCGKVYTTVATKFENNKIYYSCSGEFIGKNSKGEEVVVKGCGFEGTTDIGGGKLAWKVEFAARWRALKIIYEAYGKDIADSVKVNDEICKRILTWEPPLHSFYELFVQRGGKKISKSIGNVFTPQLWLKYAPKESMRLLFLKKLAKTRVVDIDAIPMYVEELDELSRVYFGEKKIPNERELNHLKRLYEYINFLEKPTKSKINLPYSLLINLFKIVPETPIIKTILERTEHIPKNITEREEEILTRLDYARNWVKDNKLEREIKIKLNEKEKEAILLLSKDLNKDWEEEELQKRLYEIAKESDLENKEFFKVVYRVLLGGDSGPRLAMLILTIGKGKVKKILSEI